MYADTDTLGYVETNTWVNQHQRNTKEIVFYVQEGNDRGLNAEFATSAFYSHMFDSFMSEISVYYQCEAYPTNDLTAKIASQAAQKWISINQKINTTEFSLQGKALAIVLNRFLSFLVID